MAGRCFEGIRLKNTIKLVVTCVVLTGASSLFAQQSLPPAVQNVVQLSATGSVEVPQDLLSIAMSTTRDGSDASAVQSQLKSALDAALVEAKKTAQPGQLDARTGNFSLYPRDRKSTRLNSSHSQISY